jgi:hypothetical protein
MQIVSEAAALLRANGWESSAEHFIGDRFLRVLLLDQLRHQEAGLEAAVHTTLIDHYASTPGQPAAARLYHCLALGDTEEVVRFLHASFAQYEASAWLAHLRAVIRAAHGGPPDCRSTVALGSDDRVINDEIRRSIHRMLHAAWLLADPLIAPDTPVLDQLTADLNFLAPRAIGGESLIAAGRDWPARLRTWQYLDDLAI